MHLMHVTHKYLSLIIRISSRENKNYEIIYIFRGELTSD